MHYICSTYLNPSSPKQTFSNHQIPFMAFGSPGLMANHMLISVSFEAICFLFLALAIPCATSARILDEEAPINPAVAPKASGLVETPVSSVTSVATAPAAATSTTVTNTGLPHPLPFFMHDILGGSNPSARAVTGIVTNPAVNGQDPFAKPNGAVLPVNNGVPLNNSNSALINNNNIPFLTGLSGNTANVIQNNGNNLINGGSGLLVFNGGKFHAGTNPQKLMFGTMTVIDDELTKGHELGSGLVGKAQGFYVATSEDGSSQTMAFTAMFEADGYASSFSFFGVHQTAVSESQLAIMGGTGKYVNAKGYATVKTITGANKQNTDGTETLLQIIVYLAH